MNDKRLRIYLDDHLALLVGEIELAARCYRNNKESKLEPFLADLAEELAEQQAVVKKIIQSVGGSDGIESMVKQGAVWFAEKLGRFKLNDSFLNYSDLSRVVELETLAAAAQERIAMWDSLGAVSESDKRLKDFDFVALKDQTKKHLKRLNKARRWSAVEAFTDG